AHVHGINSVYVLECHAHGVGADSSIHPKNGHLNMPELCLRRTCEHYQGQYLNHRHFHCASSVSMRKKEIGEVDCNAKALSWQYRPHVPVDGKLHAACNSKRLIDSKGGWPNKNLMSLSSGHLD